MNFENIVKKHNYSHEFSVFLYEVYNELIKFFENEQLVYNALLEVPIVSVDNCYEYAIDNDLHISNTNNAIVDSGDLKRSSGVYISRPIIEFDGKEYVLKGIKRAVLINNFDLNKNYTKGTLIHELCHLIKGYYNEYVIKDNKLYNYCGVMESEFLLSYDGTNVIQTLTNEYGVGLEEGLNSLAERTIVRNLFDPSYEIKGYGIVTMLSESLMNVFSEMNFNEILIRSQLYHNKEEIYEIMGEENYNLMSEIITRIYGLTLEMYASAMEPDKMKKIANRISKIIGEEFVPIRDEIMSVLNSSKKM